MKKFLGFLFIFAIAAVIFLIVAKDWVLKAAIEQGVTSITGFQTKVDDLKYDFPTTIQIKGFEIRNPAGFTEKVFVNIPEIYISLVLPELLKGKGLHLPEIRLNIQEVHVEKREDGVSNVELLSSVGGKGAQPGQSAQTQQPAGTQKALPFWIERLELTIRNVSYEDRSGILGAAAVVPKKMAMDLNVQNQIYTDIRDPKVLVNLILVKILNSATLGKLLNIKPEELLGDSFVSVMNGGQAILGKGVASLDQTASAITQGEVAKKAEKLLQGSVGDAKGVLGSTTTAVKDQVSGLLGKLKTVASEEKVQQ